MNNTAPDLTKENQYEFKCGVCGVTAYGPKGSCANDMLDGEQTTDDLEDECGLMRGGQCSMAGTEHCDFECPNRESELFCGSAAW